MRTGRYFVGAVIVIIVLGLITVPLSLAGKNGSRNIQAIFDGYRAFDQVAALADFGPRPGGGPGEALAAAYIKARLQSFGLNVEVQSFPVSYFEEVSMPVMEQIAPNPTIYSPNNPAGFYTMTWSGSGNVTAPVTPVDISLTSGCEAADFAGFPAGHIALIQRGACTFQVKAQNAEAAGAVGVIIFNDGQPNRTEAIRGTLGAPGVNIPVVFASYAVGQALWQAAGTAVVHLDINTISKLDSTSQNVIGTLTGTDPTQGIVYLGANYDSPSLSPGANYTSGVGAMLEAARILAAVGLNTKATLKFIAFGAGADGSSQYVEDNFVEVSTKGIGMISLGPIGVGDTLRIGNIIPDLPALLDYTKEKATSMGLNWDIPTFPGGLSSLNNNPFELAGVPAVALYQSEDPNLNTPADTPDKINLTTLENNGELAAAVMYDWAKNPTKRARKGTGTGSFQAQGTTGLLEK